MKSKGKKAKTLVSTPQEDKGAVKLNVDFATAMQLLANHANQKGAQRQAAHKK